MRLLFLICLGRALGIVQGDVANDGETFQRKNDNGPIIDKYKSNDNDHDIIHLIERQMLSLNKSSDASRDKRALGILLQGFMEALGYTVSPLQVASLANPTPGTGVPPMPVSAPSTNATATSPTPPPRQRETLRFTGVLNFGNNANTSNLVDHLARYEQLFHSDGSVRPVTLPPIPMPDIDPRGRPPLPEPLFVKIPLPIVPNLPPPQPPSPMPLSSMYVDEFPKEQPEEHRDTNDEEAQRGDYEEENDEPQGTLSSAEDENKRERNYEYDDYEKPEEKNTEKEYQNNKNVVNYSVENKDIYDPREVSEEVPMLDTRFDHSVFVNEPDWKKNHEAQLYKLAAEQEANAEALAEENAEREKNANREHESNEEDKEFHDSREKEISDRNEEADKKRKIYYNEEDDDDSESSEKENYADNRREDDEDDDYQETKISETPANKSRYVQSELSDASTEKAGVTEIHSNQNKEPTAEQKNRKKYDNAEKPGKEKKIEPSERFTTLPISYERENSRRPHPLRDSYGESLEKPDGKVDERVSSYFTMFKNPETGIYDPNRIRQYENSRLAYDHLDLVNGFKRIQKEYGLPENKYEEYEINDDSDGYVEHRGKSYSRRPTAKDYQQEKSENESRKRLRKVQPEITECECNTKKVDGQSEEARNHGKSVTAGLLPSRISQVPTNYGSHHSTVKYHYEPLDYDQSIIARLTSYDPPTTLRFDEEQIYTSNPSRASVYRHPTSVLPTESEIKERFVTKTLLPETETKEIRTWPAPFDYAYDNSENNNVIVKGTPKIILNDASNDQPVTHPIPQDTTKSNCRQEARSLPPGEFANKVQKLLLNHENEEYNLENRSKRKRRPANDLERPRVKKVKQPTTRIGYYPTLSPTSTTSNSEQGNKRQSSTERSVNYQERNRTPTYPPLALETRTPYPERTYTTRNPNQNPKVPRVYENARNSRDRQAKTRAKSTVKKKHNIHPPVIGRNSEEEALNYVEKDGILIIPEPTPYYYDERVEEFTDESPSDTQKVKIKEYRNRIASVKVSNLKQLHPTGSTQIVKYSRNL